MNAKQAREQASKSTKQMGIETYMKWITSGIRMAVEDGKFNCNPNWNKMNSVAPSKDTCAEIGLRLTNDGYNVGFDNNGILNSISW